MRQQIMDGLRGVGQGLRSFDDAYSAKLQDRVSSIAEGIEAKGKPGPLHTIGLTGAGILAQPSLRKYTEEGNDVPRWAQYGVPAASATAKYVVPGAGVTLAGMALYDLTSAMMNQQTQSAIMPN